MSFVSYAQNFEDVMLWRALGHIKNGFYVDVGANDPTIDSLSRSFYERGWHGINVEPLPSHHADLVRERPGDINLQCAAGASTGEIDLWECEVRGWATASASVVAQHTAEGHAGSFHKVPVRRLADICAQHVEGDIHFLKIDVEGFEKAVIDGMDFARFRPWILVIEATRPNSPEENYQEWEGSVLDAGYGLAYSDGLNRFYVALEHAELLGALRYPPNVLDGFALGVDHFFSRLTSAKAGRAENQAQRAEDRRQRAESQAQRAEDKSQRAETRAQLAETRAQLAETRTQQAEARAQQAEARAQQAEATGQQAFAQTQALLNSRSWRATAPLRVVGHAGRELASAIGGNNLVSRLKQQVRPALQRLVGWGRRRPGVKRAVLPIFNRLPGLKMRLRRLSPEQPSVAPPMMPIDSVDALPARAAMIYADLKMAVQRRKG